MALDGQSDAELHGQSTCDEDLLRVAETMMGASLSDHIVARWRRAADGTKRMSTARRQRNEARVKALQRTPYPIVVNRLRVLLDRIAKSNGGLASAAAGQKTARLPPGFRLKMPTETAERPREKASPREAQLSPRSDRSSSPRSLYESYVDEASLLLAHVSPFLKKIPDEFRRELCSVIHVEETKREEVIFNIGDLPEKFYVILTGLVEVTEKLVTNDRREKYVIANLKKGYVFGEAAILNNKRRNATCVAVTQCVLLTVLKDDFLAVVGPHFFGQKRETVTFLRHRVTPLKNVDRDACLSLLPFLMRMEYPADKEWDIHREKHVYFIQKGHCALYLCEGTSKEKSSTEATVERDGAGDIYFVDGRPFGTLLNKEAKRRAHSRKAQGRREMASLTPGDYFGGGWNLLGDSKEAKSLRICSKTPVDVLILRVDDLVTYADPEILRSLREDAAFRFTYYFGRQGLLDAHGGIGHPSTAMLSRTAPSRTRRNEKRRRALDRQLKQDNDEGHHRFSDSTEEALRHFRQLLESDALDIEEARYDRGTPTERYLSDLSLTRGLAHRQLDPLLMQIFPRGFEPLSQRVERQAQRRAEQQGRFLANAWAASFRNSRGGRPQTSPNIPRQHKNVEDERPSAMQKRDLLAATVMWERTARPATAMRQCLTYAEIVRNKNEKH